MDGVDWGSLARLVPEVIIVLIFVWFTLERDKRAEAAETQRQIYRKENEARRDEEWRTFLREEREWRASTSKEVANELKELTQVVVNTNALLVAHDTSMKILAAKALSESGKSPTGGD